MSDYRSATKMYNRAFKPHNAYIENGQLMHKGLPVRVVSQSFDYAGAGIDGCKAAYQNTGEFLKDWFSYDPVTRNPENFAALAKERAEASGRKASVSKQMLYTYMNGVYKKVYKMNAIPVEEFPKWLTKNLPLLMKNTRVKKFLFEAKMIDGKPCMIVYTLDAEGNRVPVSVDYYCCNPKSVYRESISETSGAKPHEVAGYGISSRKNKMLAKSKVTDFKVIYRRAS